MGQDGYCTLPDPGELERIEREWAEGQPPAPLMPPMANVHLAVELATGLDEIRDFEYRGATYRFAPTWYDVAIRMLAWLQELERLQAMGELIGEHLTELRPCYAEIISLAGSLVLPPHGPDTFLDATWQELDHVCAFILETDQEAVAGPTRHREDRSSQRYDAVYHLKSYESAFGKKPVTWKDFCAGMATLRRRAAEEALQMYGAVGSAQSGGQGAERWLELQHREAGAG